MALTKVEGGVIADNTVSALQLNVDGNGADGYRLISDGDGSMSWQAGITNPTITSIDYPGTATAADTGGGESVIINGTLFASGITCTVGGTAATTAFNSTTQITITTPAKAAGSYAIAVTNTDGGTATQASFIQYSGIPIWTTAAGNIGSVQEGAAASFQVTATEGSDTIEYAVTTGTLPTGLSLATATGAITGTAGSVSADTTTTFSITATDDENQTSAVRSFNIIVTNDAPSNHFNTLIWTGDAVQGRAITTNNFQADFIWLKQRTSPGTRDPIIVDTVRGGTGTGPSATNFNLLYPYGTFAESTSVGNSYIPSIQNNGFTLGNSTYSNQSGAPTVAWSLKAGGAATTIAANTVGNTIASDVSVNNTLGFSIVKATSPSSGVFTVGHGLNAAPELYIIKNMDSAGGWLTYVESLGADKYLQLNESSAAGTSTNFWDNTLATTTVFTMKSGSVISPNVDFVAYCFASKAGFSKVGTYVGNGSTKSIVTGFEVGFVMIKSTNASTGWSMYDSVRGGNKGLEANTAAAEFSNANNIVNFYANGFGVTSLNHENTDLNDYIYLAFAVDGSTSTPSLADSFSTITYTGNGGTQSTNSLQSQSGTLDFATDFTWIKARDDNSWHALQNTITGATKHLYSNATNAQDTTSDGLTSFNNNGFTLGSANGFNTSSKTYVAWNWKAGGLASINTTGTIPSLVSANQAAGFSIVKWTGTGVDGKTIGHGLSTPDLIITKGLSNPTSWIIGIGNISGFSINDYMNFNAGPKSNSSTFYQAYGASTFQVGVSGANEMNKNSSNDYISYCFKSIANYSQVGIYTGTGNASVGTISTGFAPGFVMIKGSSNNGNWVMLDNKRGGTSRNQLDANDPHVEYANQGVEFVSTGFKPRQSVSLDTNTASVVYIYLAIKEN